MRPRRADRAISQDFADGTIAVLDPTGERVLMLNPTGAAVWALCDGTRTVDDIAVFVHAHTSGAALDQVRGDVESLLGELARAGLLGARPECGP
jgi:pyrroloquinoline quinone biosynthesis protein D